jgi:hypothetical protein
LLTKTIQGIDIDGDAWTLKLFGPGDFAVINQNGADGQPVPIGQPGLIKSITIGGANPGATRLVGAVTPGATGDGRVYFRNLSETASEPPSLGVGVGTLAVDLPGFWLGKTDPADTSTTAGTIEFEDGIATLRFGGVDTTAFGVNTNGRADKFTIDLGLPTRTGTSIIIDSAVSSFQAGTGTNAAGFQDTIDFTVEGRINLFQANSIEGDPTLNLGTTGRFEGNTFNSVGTTVTSTTGGATTLGGLTGFIGRVRVGGNATNFNVRVISAAGDDGAITNLSIGGETNKVTIDAATGLRNAQFGVGMDTVAINAERIQNLAANRGAVGSTIVTRRDAGLLTFGGDVQNTQVLAGYTEDASGNRVAQELGRMTVLIAGDVTDSLFAASVDPNEDGVFGSADDLNAISGGIDAKVEGFIDNSLNPDVDLDSADQAFFARKLHVAQGPIVPPASSAAPYTRTPNLPRTVVPGIGGGPKGPAYRFVRALNRRGANG